MKRIIRVFPARTHATPDDDLVRINAIPSLFDEADEVHISVAFTWHLKWAEWAAKQWACVAPVKVGGPALNEPGGDFIPGMYLKKGTLSPRAAAQTVAGSALFPNVRAASFGNYLLRTAGLSRMIIYWPALPDTLTRYSPCWPDNHIGLYSRAD